MTRRTAPGRPLVSGRVARLLPIAVLAAVPQGAPAAEPRSATICSSCHVEIKKQWESSSKASSWTNPVFQAFLADAKRTLGNGAAAKCLPCHAPLAAVTGDLTVDDSRSQEGVTCNFCHNVSEVEVSDRPASYTWDPSDPNLMRGPYADAEPGNAHSAVFSEIQTQSGFCASCHWFARDGEAPVIDATYPQWKSSRAAAAGTQCQDCHMPPAPGKAALTATKTRPKVYAHTFRGAHTPGVLDSAATLAAGIEGGRLKLTVTSARGGHALPGGGGSMRAITLEVVYRDAAGKELARVPVQTYGTQFADSAGNAPVPKWLARSVSKQEEIPADAPRIEWAAIPPQAKRAEAVLTYHFLLPAFRSALEARSVDLNRHQPRVMASAAVVIP